MIIEKIVAPCDLSSKEPYGTQWHADLESGKQIWIQTSEDIENPKWVRLGDLYEMLVTSYKSSDMKKLFGKLLTGMMLINQYGPEKYIPGLEECL